jgi:DNA polymerase-3 subunit delta'
MSFNDIIGHDRPVQVLKRALAGGTVAHAYLFSGDEGIGKRMTARALAAAVNCLERGPEGGCGTCPSCRKVAAGSHPDVHLLAPDGAEIKIDQIREVQSDLSLCPFEGAKKVLIVDGAETMNDASSNALLKTLEEPPGETVIILVTSRPQGLLPTIRSRCQEVVSRFRAGPCRCDPGETGPFGGRVVPCRGRAGGIGRALEIDAVAERRRRRVPGALVRWGPWVLKRSCSGDALSKERERFDRLLDIGVERLRDMAVYAETGTNGCWSTRSRDHGRRSGGKGAAARSGGHGPPDSEQEAARTAGERLAGGGEPFS